MNIKLPIKYNNKIIECDFNIKKTEDNITINLLKKQNFYTTLNKTYFDIPCCNNFNCIYYQKVSFPIIFNILKVNNKKYLINDSFMEIAYNSSDYDLDFYNILSKQLNDMNIINFNDLTNENIIKEIFIYINNKIKLDNYNEKKEDFIYIEEGIDFLFNIVKFWFNNILFLLKSIGSYTNKNIKNSQYFKYIPKKLISICNRIKIIKISFKCSDKYTIDNHLKKLDSLYITESSGNFYLFNSKKFRKIYVKKITSKNIILNDKILDKKNFTIHYYPPSLLDLCNRNNFINFLSINFNIIYPHIIKKLFTENKSLKINNFFDYYFIENNNLEYLSILKSIYNFTKSINYNFILNDKLLDKINISNHFFFNLIDKLETEEDKFNFIKVLFKKYSFPLKYNKKIIEPRFEKILYFSILNCDLFLVNINKKYYIHPDLIDFISVKVKTLYFNNF